MTRQNRSLPIQPLLLLGNFGLQVLTLLVAVGIGLSTHRLNNKPAPTLVQTTDGQAFRVKAIPSESRSPVAIKAFVSSILPQLFNWSGEITTDTDETIRDPGITLESASGASKGITSNGTAKKVPTASATASMALSEDFRLAFLQRVAELVPSGVFSGQTQVVMVVEQVSEPERLEAGKWQLNVLAHLNVFNSQNALQETIPFHRAVVVESTSAPLMPAGETPLERAVYTIRQAGLQITDIRAIER